MEKKNKTPQEKIAKSSARYYQKKDEILRSNCLKHVTATGKLPLETSMDKYNITWKEISECLQTHIKENSIVQLLEPVGTESQALKKYRRMFPRRSQKNDDLSYLYNAYINTYLCDTCGENFTNDRKRTCNLDDHGFFTRIVCSDCEPCLKKFQAEELLENIQAE